MLCAVTQSVLYSYDATYGFSDKKILDNTDAMSPLEIHFRCRNTLAERSRLQLVLDRICNNEELERSRGSVSRH